MATECIPIPELTEPIHAQPDSRDPGPARERATLRWSLGRPGARRSYPACADHSSGCPTPSAGFSYFACMRVGEGVVVLAGPYATHLAAVSKLDEVSSRVPRGCLGRTIGRFFTAIAPSDYHTLFGPA
jgi:hypothetical protein